MTKTSPPSIAVVGAGAMGSNHARVIAASSVAQLDLVVDVDADRARRTAELYGAAWSTETSDALRCQAAVVAVPGAAQARVAHRLLEAGLPLLVEKPLSTTLADAERVVALAESHDLPLMCGFVERFNPVVRAAASIMEGPPLHLVAIRHSPPNPRATSSVVLDLLIHDIDLSLTLTGASGSQRTVGVMSAIGAGIAERADAVLELEGGAVATLSASRTSQRKVRSLSLTTSTQLIELDLIRQDITVYRHVGHEQTERQFGYRAETVIDVPFVRQPGEPLHLQLLHFLDLLTGAADAPLERQRILPAHRISADLLEAAP